MRLLKLPHGGRQLLIREFGTEERSSGLFAGSRGVGLHRDGLGRIQRRDVSRRIADLTKLRLQGRQLPDVLSVHALRDVLECPHGFFTGIPRSEAYKGQLEQRDGRCQPLRGLGVEDLARFMKRRDGAQPSFHREPTDRQDASVECGWKAAQARVIGRSVADIDEGPTGQNIGASGLGQMIKGRLHRRPDDLCTDRREPITEHISAGVVLEQCHGGTADQLGEALPQRDEGTVEVGSGGQRVRQRGK